MSGHPEIRSRADLPAGIVAAEQAGAPGLAHLLRALRAGRIAFLPLLPECSASRLKVFIGLTRDRPAVILIPDDDYRDRGPSGWRVARRAVRWAATVVLHAAGAELEHYELAVQAALATRRVLFIECSTATADAWLNAIRTAPNRPSIALFIPRNGGAHPILPGREAMQ